MKSKSLRNIFRNNISSSAFHVIDGETRIMGKFAQIALLDNGGFDIWLVGPELEPLSTRKLNAIIKKFPKEASFTVLTGEAYTQVINKKIVLETLPLLGIKKKRKVSAKTRERLIAQLAKARNIDASAKEDVLNLKGVNTPNTEINSQISSKREYKESFPQHEEEITA